MKVRTQEAEKLEKIETIRGDNEEGPRVEISYEQTDYVASQKKK